MGLQPFKPNDAVEQKVTEVGLAVLDPMGEARDEFFDNAYTAYPLGDVLYDLDADPTVEAIEKANYRESFFAIHQLFTRPGTYEFFLSVFRAIWGNDVQVEFDNSTPGILLINIQALSASEDDFVARRIENNTYIYDQVVDEVGDVIQFQDMKGIKTQADTDALVFELYCAGVYVKATLLAG